MDFFREGLGRRVFIIAEAGVNHNGCMDTAFKLVDAAREAGADAVKFQTFKAENLVTVDAAKADYQKETTDANETQLGMLKKLELPLDAFKKIYQYCLKKGIMFMSTPFDHESVELLETLGAAVYKVGSGDLTNMPLLKHIASRNKPVILSTGMATLEEVEEAVGWVKAEGNDQIVLMHCTTAYPAPYEEANLKALLTMKQAFGLPTGYSDHTRGIEAAVAAAALGACVIEKHITLDKGMPGPDHRASLDPAEFREMVRCIRNVEKAMGSGAKLPGPGEEKMKIAARKSIVAREYIRRGERIEMNKIAVKRPGNGIMPKYYYQMPRYRARVDIKADTVITWGMLEKEEGQ